MAENPSEATVGEYWIDEQGQVWKQIMYTDRPTVTFQLVADEHQRLSGVVGSQLLNGHGLRRLVPDGG